jgi:hypothetical protein
VLGSGAGTLTMSGQSALTVEGSLAVNSASAGGTALSGQAALRVTGTLVSPAAAPVTLSGQATDAIGTTEQLGPEEDPYASLAPPDTTGMAIYASSSIRGPGVYTQAVTVSAHSTVQLATGIYVFDNGLTISGQATVSTAAGGVLLYFAGGTLTVSGQAGANLAPLAIGPYGGILLFEARGDSQAIAFSGQGQTTSLAGAVYAPAAAVEDSGASTLLIDALVSASVASSGQSRATIGSG